MTIDPKVHAIATMFVDQLLAEINPPAEFAFSSVERNDYIERTAAALQQAIEYELSDIRWRFWIREEDTRSPRQARPH